jgi:hypothetical protein
MDAPDFSYVMINMYEKYDDKLVGSQLIFVRGDVRRSIGSSWLFVCGDARVKSSRSKEVRRSIGSPWLFVCGDTRVKSSRSREVR